MSRAEYALLSAPRWRVETDRVELWDPKRERWTSLAPFTATLLEGVESERSIEELARLVGRADDDARARRKREARARRFLYNLSRLGHVDIPFAAPDAFAGRYRVQRELGRGGVGVAYLCDDLQAGTTLVVKRAWDFLQPYAITESAMRREHDVMRRLDHPGVARAYDAFELDGHLHLVREFLEGDDLSMAQGQGVGEGWREVARGIADVLAHLHERGFLLLDLRPSNFVLDPETRRPRLLDVGGCREHHGGAVGFPKRVGSPGFMSPEMGARKMADVRSDVWGFGRLVGFLATGALPPKDADAAALLARLPADVAPVVARLAADDPRDRPATMRDVLALL